MPTENLVSPCTLMRLTDRWRPKRRDLAHPVGNPRVNSVRTVHRPGVSLKWRTWKWLE
jgi:hypothetical protein